MSKYWDYSGLYGEDTWKNHCLIGYNQSPINILTSDVKVNVDYANSPLRFKGKDVVFEYANKGNNISFKPVYGENEKPPSISGGPLSGTYCFHECHFHWGRINNKGSEHQVDGVKSDAELHIVHRSKDCTFEGAMMYSSGLCVLGVFIEAEDNATTPPFLKRIMNTAKHVGSKNKHYTDSDHPGNPYTVVEGISKEYFTYEGGLTTPPVTECVRWIVFNNGVKVSRADLAVLQGLFAVESETKVEYHDPFNRSNESMTPDMPKIGDNYRGCYPLEGRVVEKSF